MDSLMSRAHFGTGGERCPLPKLPMRKKCPKGSSSEENRVKKRKRHTRLAHISAKIGDRAAKKARRRGPGVLTWGEAGGNGRNG